MGLLDPPGLSRSTLASTPEAGNDLIPIGDSITAPSLPNYGGPSWSILWAILSNQQVHLTRNAGVGGNTTTQMLARIDADVIAYKPRYCAILGGTNDQADNATFRANIAAMVAKLRAAGITPILGTVPPRGDTTVPIANIVGQNEWLRFYAAKNRVKLIDFHAAMVNPATGLAQAGLLQADNTHPTAAGALLMAQTAQTELANFLAPAPKNMLPLYGLAGSKTGNHLNANPLMAGTSPAFSGGWSYNPSSQPAGVTRALVADPRFAGQAVQWTVAASASFDNFQTNINAADWAVGDTLRIVAKIAVDNPSAIGNNGGLSIGFVFTGGTPSSTNVLLNMPNQLAGTFVGDYTVPPGTTALVAKAGIGLAGGSATVFVGQMAVYNLTRLGVS